jgi:rhamnogalacturonyl hydrolase YesR
VQKQAAALLQYQMSDGSWDSILNDPGYTESEMSGTALVGYGFLKGYHEGWLSRDYLSAALRAWKALNLRLSGDDQERSLHYISGPTQPGSKKKYRNRVRRVSNAHYGIGAYLMLASEFKSSDWE